MNSFVKIYAQADIFMSKLSILGGVVKLDDLNKFG